MTADRPRRRVAPAGQRASKRTPLGRLLQERREALGFSRARTSALTGIRPGTIEGWELGRVAKPPLDDVLRLARFLGISPEQLVATVLDGDRADRAPSGPGAVPLLEQAIALFGWTEQQAAAALHTTVGRLRTWRAGNATMSLPEVMTVAALLGLHAAGAAAAGQGPDRVASVLAGGSPPERRPRRKAAASRS